MTAAAGGEEADDVLRLRTTTRGGAGAIAAGAAWAAAGGGDLGDSSSASHASTLAQAFPFGGAAVAENAAGGGAVGVGQNFALPQHITGTSGEEALKVMISTTTADSLEKILDWAQYHRLIGVDVSWKF